MSGTAPGEDMSSSGDGHVVTCDGEDGEESETKTARQREGGWGWIVCFGSFWIHGVVFGLINSFGVLYVEMIHLAYDKKNAASYTSLVGSICVGATFSLSTVSSLLTDRFGVRPTVIAGGVLATTAVFLSSWVRRLEVLWLTYGVLLGVGAALAYTPSLVILGHYFDRRVGLVNGIATAGSSVFTVLLPILLRFLLRTIQLQHTLQVVAALMSTVALCGFTFKYPPGTAAAPKNNPKEKNACCGLLNKTIWKNRKYVIWAAAIPFGLFGYFVSYVHIVKHANDILPEATGEQLVVCLGVTSGIGRIVFGKLADFPAVNPIVLQQISFVCIGTLTMFIVLADTFVGLVFICLLMGLFDGCFISLIAPVARDLVGQEGSSQAIGFLFAFCALPLTIGPPVAGVLYDRFGNYTAAFLAAGIPPIIAAALMCFTYKCQKSTRTPENRREIPLGTRVATDASDVH
ncbi:monocarboxylate transporter 10-like [Ornithodoros turicata]|uniref:monocarboxylate transporter 10-like n=1 Tax=Ornithodoros turicata TaxID=34597 RepID=UPI0031398C0F